MYVSQHPGIWIASKYQITLQHQILLYMQCISQRRIFLGKRHMKCLYCLTDITETGVLRHHMAV